MDIDKWPNCPTPDCQHKVCLWAGTGLCSPCSDRKVGKLEMEKRYLVTHDGVTGRWNGIPYAE